MADTEVFKLNLDASEFMETLNKTADSLESLGESSEGLNKVVSIIGQGTALVGTLGVAFLAAKSALDWAEEAQEIQRVNDLFGNLTQQAGISTETLRSGLEKASNGMISSTELTKLGNQAIIELGSNAAKLPDIMTLAQKTTQVFGGSLTSNFQTITQAVANGNTKMLKHMGIIVDANKAYVDYAKSIGSTVDQLSQSEKQTAVMNAVLEQGGEKFKNVKLDSDNMNTSIAQIKTTVSEMGEIFTKVFGTLVTPAVKTALSATKGFLENLKGWGSYLSDKILGSTAKWGENLQVTSKQLEDTSQHLHEMQAELGDLERQGTSTSDPFQNIVNAKKIAELKKNIDIAKAEIHGLSQVQQEQKAEEDKATAEGAADVKAQQEKEKYDKRIANETQFNKEMLALKQQQLKENAASESSDEEVEENFRAERLKADQDYVQKILEINKRANEGKLSPGEAAALQAEQTKLYNQQIENSNDDLVNRKIAAYQRDANASDKASEQFADGWKIAANKAIQANSNFSTMGQAAFSTIGSRATQAFKAIGSGSQNAGQAMETFFLGALGDMATKQGEFFLMKGLGEMAMGNPAGGVLIAEGGGLIALGALLGSMASGGSTSTSSSSSSGGTAAAAGVDTSGAASAATAPTPTPQKTVTVQVMGNVFNTDDTKNAIMNLIRQETDATDFKYQQIGV